MSGEVTSAVKVELDRAVIFMLATLSNEKIPDVAANLLDEATRLIKRLIKQDKSLTRTKTYYGDTKVVINLTCSHQKDKKLLQSEIDTWINTFNSKFGTHYNTRHLLYGIHPIDTWRGPAVSRSGSQLVSDIPGAQIWMHKNPPPKWESRHNYVRVRATLDKDYREVSISKEDIDNHIIETILLGGELDE